MIVIDTHVLLWWVSGDRERLSERAFDTIERSLLAGGVYVSTITAWEIAMLVDRGRVALTGDTLDWLATVARLKGVFFVPVDIEIAVLSTRLGDHFHKDPADRMIAATARKLMAPLVTADERLQSYADLSTIW